MKWRKNKMEVRVLFICLGNICRSPMAEAIFRDLVKKEKLQDHITCDSAGTGGWHTGNPPHQGTREILKKNLISDTGILARQLQTADLDSFDYLIAMDNSNRENIRLLNEQLEEIEVHLLMDFAENRVYEEVPDPYYTGNFDEVYKMVTDGCRGLLRSIRNKYHL